MRKNKLIVKYLTIFFFIFILISVLESVLALQAKIEFEGEPSYYFYKEKENKYYYLINVTLKNTGDISSCPIDIKIREGGFDSVCQSDCRGVVFEPGEQKTFSIDWGTGTKGDEIEIVYTASNPADISTYNTGRVTLEIGHTQENTDKGVPGFSLLVLIFSIFTIYFIRKN